MKLYHCPACSMVTFHMDGRCTSCPGFLVAPQVAPEPAPVVTTSASGDKHTPPTVWHVLVLSSGNPTPARPPEIWHRFRAIYGEGYPWREATEVEITEAKEWMQPMTT